MQLAVDNRTPFACTPLFLTDAAARPLLVVVVKATFLIGRTSQPTLALKQRQVSFTGESWGQLGESSYRYEPETAFTKSSTDVALVGHACSRRGPTRELDVSFRVGRLQKTVRVLGNRRWVKRFGGRIAPTDPEPFVEMPLAYECAFGGWDRSNLDPTKHSFDPRNPVGTGYRNKHSRFEEGVALPNLVDPHDSGRGYGDNTAAPCGFGFISPSWQPRAAYAGTYDARWIRTRMPMLPTDFDPRFFNAASAGLVAEGFLLGNEAVHVQNGSHDEDLSFSLPGVAPPELTVEMRGKSRQQAETCLDTVVVDTDDNLLILTWRGSAHVRGGPPDVTAISVVIPQATGSIRGS